MRHFFTADLHFGHGNIMKYCSRTPWMSDAEILKLQQHAEFDVSFDSIARMNTGLVDEINKVVSKDDVLWILGDFCFGPHGNLYNAASTYRQRIQCETVHMVWGNHDNTDVIGNLFTSCHDPCLIAIAEDGEYWIGQSAVHRIKNKKVQKIVLSHSAFAVWDGSHKGWWNLYGHSHTTAEEWMDKHMPGRRSLDVGVDNAKRLLGAYRPFSFELDLVPMMAKQSGFSMDQHQQRR